MSLLIRIVAFIKHEHCRDFTVSALLAALILNGCALKKLKLDIDKVNVSSLLWGVAVAKSDREGPQFVVAYEVMDGDIRMAGHVRLSQSGAYELLVPAGKYFLAAFQDTNDNGRCDPHEDCAQFGAPDLIDAESHDFVGDLNMALTSNRTTALPHISKIFISKDEIVDRAVAGEIVDPVGLIALDGHHSQGYWEPFSFFKDDHRTGKR